VVGRAIRLERSLILSVLTANTSLSNYQLPSSDLSVELPTSTEDSTCTSPSAEYDSYEKIKAGGHVVQLPAPFFPPSLAQAVDSLIPRGLPSALNLPLVPDVKANVGIDTMDMYVTQLLLTTVEVTSHQWYS
jgi:hypothetical protein